MGEEKTETFSWEPFEGGGDVFGGRIPPWENGLKKKKPALNK